MPPGVVPFCRIVVCALDPRVRSRITTCLTELGLPHAVLPAEGLPERPTGRTVYVLGSGALDRMPEGHWPVVVVTSGARIPDDALPRIVGTSLAVVPLAQLGPAPLLAALLRVGATLADVDVIARIGAHGPFRGIPRCVVEGVMLHGRVIGRPRDLCRRLGWTRARLAAVARGAGFLRSEHLITALRAEAWVVLVGQGVARRAVEEQLGIFHRPTFRRACRRAGVSAPWERVRFRGSAG